LVSIDVFGCYTSRTACDHRIGAIDHGAGLALFVTPKLGPRVQHSVPVLQIKPLHRIVIARSRVQQPLITF
jgi:hypothetical protein